MVSASAKPAAEQIDGARPNMSLQRTMGTIVENFWITGLFVLVVASSTTSVKGQVQAKTVQKQFVSGRQLVKSNCIDCTGGTRAGMEEGIRAVEEALQAGYPDQKAAYKLLLNAYDELAPTQRRIRQRIRLMQRRDLRS